MVAWAPVWCTTHLLRRPKGSHLDGVRSVLLAVRSMWPAGGVSWGGGGTWGPYLSAALEATSHNRLYGGRCWKCWMVVSTWQHLDLQRCCAGDNRQLAGAVGVGGVEGYSLFHMLGGYAPLFGGWATTGRPVAAVRIAALWWHQNAADPWISPKPGLLTKHWPVPWPYGVVGGGQAAAGPAPVVCSS